MVVNEPTYNKRKTLSLESSIVYIYRALFCDQNLHCKHTHSLSVEKNLWF